MLFKNILQMRIIMNIKNNYKVIYMFKYSLKIKSNKIILSYFFLFYVKFMNTTHNVAIVKHY